jgi:hypothetical protein
MMKLIPLRAVKERLGLSYDQIVLDPILKVVKKDKRDYVLSASVTAYKRNDIHLARRPSKVHGHGRVSRIFRVFGSSRVIEKRETA